MKLFRDKHGVISVFLAIILVPSIVASCVFVDLGRVYMSESTAEASSDLALNSLLTQYDTELNEWYGIVASCQTIDEFYDESAEFFLRTISSQGLTDEELYSVSDYYANATGDDSIYDFLQVSVEGDVTISAVEGTDLSNAAMMKDKIVEFMKYRAPIEISVNLIDRFKSNSESMGLDAAVEAEENEELVDDKTDFYTAEGELLKTAYYSYLSIRKYSDYELNSGDTLTNDVLEEYVENLNEYKEKYEEIHTVMVTDLYNTADLTSYNRVTVAINSYENTYDASDVCSTQRTSQGETTYYIDDAEIKFLIEELETEISDYNAAKVNYKSAIESLASKNVGTGSSDAYNIQWWVQFHEAVNTGGTNSLHSKLAAAAENMIKSYAKVATIVECTYDEDVDVDNFEDTYGYQEILDEVELIQSKYLTKSYNSDTDTYLKTVKLAETISQDNTDSFSKTKTEITSELSTISSELSADIADLEQLVEYLDIAINGESTIWPFTSDYKSLDTLLESVETYRAEMNEWTNTANNTNTDLGDSDKIEVAEYKESNNYDEINAAAVSELKTRLTNIKTQLQTVIDGMNSLKYGSTSAVDIKTYDTFETAASSIVKESEIGLTNSSLESYADSTFSSLISPTTENVLTLSNLNNSEYNVQIDPDSGNVDTPALYIYLHGKFKDEELDEVESYVDALEDNGETGENKEDEVTKEGRYSGGGSAITWEYSDEATYGLGSSILTGLPSFFLDIADENIDAIRDDLYVVTYLMEMFSYATYENEGKYDLLDDTEKEKLSISLVEDAYTEEYKTVEGTANTDETWLSENVTDTYNKSLTNHILNTDNNTAYGAELEYILYGGEDSTNQQNVKAAYSDIYTVRYALNLVSGFANFWTMGTNTTATALNNVAITIAGATGGIVPAPAVMVVLIPILTAFETAVDLERLEAGYPVELYKMDDGNWWLAFPEDFDTDDMSVVMSSIQSGEIPKTNENTGLFYSDYIMVFLYLGLTDEDTANAMYQRMGEVMQSNISKVNGGVTYSMTNAYTYFQLDAILRVEPLMLTLPIMDGNDYGLTTNTDWCTYKISTIRGYS